MLHENQILESKDPVDRSTFTLKGGQCNLKCSRAACVAELCMSACPQKKNWPRCRPFLRHSISEDVPEERRGLVWRGYWAWILMAAGFAVDWLTITIM
jgi:hypothetical protein